MVQALSAQAAYLLIIGLQNPHTQTFISVYVRIFFFTVVAVLVLADSYMYIYMQL